MGAKKSWRGRRMWRLRRCGAEERVSSMDTLRGFALMGILVMNICDFALSVCELYVSAVDGEAGIQRAALEGEHDRCGFCAGCCAEGKMRGLFSMLFGAGVILLTQRAEARGAGVKVADIFTRRNMWLVLFGMLHAYLIWDGDILFFYGVAALLFLFPFRNVRAKRLMWTAGIVLFAEYAGAGCGPVDEALHARRRRRRRRWRLYAKNHVVTEEQRKAIDANDKQEGQTGGTARREVRGHCGEAEGILVGAGQHGAGT